MFSPLFDVNSKDLNKKVLTLTIKQKRCSTSPLKSHFHHHISFLQNEF